MSYTDLPIGAGVSLKPEYFEDVSRVHQPDFWLEVHPENYMVEGGPRLDGLLDAAERFPISLHGVAASLGGSTLTAASHIRALSKLIQRVNPAAVSEHAAWSILGNQYFAELLPLPRTAEALTRLIAGVNHLQEGIGRTILLENPSSYLPANSEMSEPEFLVEVAKRTGCGLLIDVNNIHVSANNCGVDAVAYLQSIPGNLVGEIHIAGFSADENPDNNLLIDSHASPVSETVWRLLEFALARFGPVPVLVERDANLPAFHQLMGERNRAHALINGAQMEMRRFAD